MRLRGIRLKQTFYPLVEKSKTAKSGGQRKGETAFRQFPH
jgi:hypothetical protein